MSEIHCT